MMYEMRIGERPRSLSWYFYSPSSHFIMPPRGVIVGIVAFWTFMTGWLFFRELWPRFQSGQPPPFRIDLADEAQNEIPVRWSIFKDEERPRGYIRNWVNFRDQDDTFELVGEFKLWKTTKTEGQPDFIVKSRYRVTREGELREFLSTIALRVPDGLRKGAGQEKFESDAHIELLRLTGEVRDNVCYAHIKVTPEIKEWVPLVSMFEREMEPVPMPKRASMLNTLAPVNKLAKVKKGQRWRIPVVDPLTIFWKQSPRMQYLDAQVLDETVWLKWGAKKDPVPCLVIEYQGDDISGHTWIQEEDGLVVRQEITQHGDKLELRRD